MAEDTALEVRQQPGVLAPQGLGVRSLDEAVRFAEIAYRSGLLPKAIDSQEKATVILLKGLELGLSPMQAFAGINVIQGKAEVAAELMIGLCARSPVCKYFRLLESTDSSATFETWRTGHAAATSHTFTLEDAERLQIAGKDNWKKQARTMLRWRCASALAKMVYPDLVLGLYVPGEITESVTLEEVPTHERMSVAKPAAAAPAEAPAKPAGNDLEGALRQIDGIKELPALDTLAKKLGSVKWTKAERATVAGAFNNKRKALSTPPKAQFCEACGSAPGAHAHECPLGPDAPDSSEPAPERDPGEEG